MKNRVLITLRDGDGPDLIDMMSEMSKAEFFALVTLKDRIDKAVPQILISQVAFSVYQKAMFKSGVNGLIAKNLARRERRSHYVINPDAIQYPELFNKRVQLWKSLADE